MSRCRGAGCGADIRWVLTEAGRAMPIDPAPDPDGTLVDTGRRGEHHGTVTPIVAVDPDPQPTLPGMDTPTRYRPHWSTCPDADAQRRRNRP